MGGSEERARPDERWTLALLILIAGLGLVHVGGYGSTVADLAYVVAFGLVGVLAWAGVRRTPAGQRLVPATIAVGVGFSSLGDVIGLAYDRSGEQPGATWADPWYLVAFVVLSAALVLVLARTQRDRGFDAALDALTIVTVSVLVVWHFSIAGYIVDAASTTLARVSVSGYAATDAVLLGLLSRVLLVRRARSRSTTAFAAGALTWAVSDIVFLARGAEGAELAVLDLGWLVGSVLLALAVRDAGQPRTIESAPVDDRLQHHRRLAIAVLPLLVPVALVILGILADRVDDVWVQLVGLGVLIGVVVLRTARLLASERRTQAELVVARDAALDASRAKSAFLATMGHEIRTPMNGVLGYTGLLVAADLDERAASYARGAENAGRELLDLLNDILDYARLEAGEIVLDEADLDLAALLDQVAEQVVDRGRVPDVELIVTCDPAVPLGLRGDAERLQQVLRHLVGNALKFTEAGEVVVAVRAVSPASATDVRLRFEVRDTGPGIAPEEVERLFDPFALADASTTRRHRGTGLGLAVVQRLVAAMGGEVGATSTPGVGSTFWFTLPMWLAIDPRTAPAASVESLAGVRVLIVDDNATSRTILVEQTRSWGMEPTAVASGLEALALLTGPSRTPDGFEVAVLDLSMPDMDGLQLADRISGLRAPRPGLVLLTDGPDVTAADAAAAGIEARIAKPASLPRLRRALLQVLGSGEAAAVPEPPTHLAHVLVVQAPGTDRAVTLGVLGDLGCSTEVATDVRGALYRLRVAGYDAVLVDLALPGADRVVRSAQRREPPVAVVGLATPGTDRAGRAAMETDELLTTPVSPAATAAVFRRLAPVSA